jgi:hypothetical protein
VSLIEQNDDHTLARAKALADAIKDVAAELRLIDVADFIAYIHVEQFGNIQDIVTSAVEMFFKHGTLSYGWAAEFEIEWDRPPTIMIDMEFRHMSVSFTFGLTLQAAQAGVVIRHIAFDDVVEDPQMQTQRLIEAITDAKLPLLRR